ncbi:fluoride efflux transporter FluC [Millisia brevis]|uniref:fluoride efflux transporter FluC n=1 Tax=Millisia brevis TaxID=264148 RepID=UPI0008367DBC|nr:CrcB family protein [Millisia brevis]
MSALAFVCVALAGGVGAACRLMLDGVLRSRFPGRIPRGTIVINISGSFLLGLAAGVAASGFLPPVLYSVVGAGFMGGYTTFSTASFETVRLFQQGRWRLGVVNGFGVLIAAVAAAGLGLLLGGLV